VRGATVPLLPRVSVYQLPSAVLGAASRFHYPYSMLLRITSTTPLYNAQDVTPLAAAGALVQLLPQSRELLS
jgi:hypothetical protein